MKNALILHGTLGSPEGNWFSWLKKELENKGYKVWLPKLPDSELPNLKKYNKFIFSNKDWEFNSESIIVGHSSGAVAILGILNELPENVVVRECILVSCFEKDSPGGKWEPSRELFDYNFDFEKIKRHANKFVLINSDNDMYCPVDGAKAIANKLGAKLIVKEGQGHFNLDVSPQYKEFPFLLTLI
jgi:uncharacterized protein